MRLPTLFLNLILIFLGPVNSFGKKPPSSVKSQKETFFSLANQWQTDSGESIKLDKFKGKYVLATLIFTSCRGTCPMIMKTMESLDKFWRKNTDLKFEVLAFSVDPDIDTPRVLNSYREKNKFTQTNWHFLVAPLADTRNVADRMGLGYGEKSGGTQQIMHTNKIVLIDPQGKVVLEIDGINEDFGGLLKYLRTQSTKTSTPNNFHSLNSYHTEFQYLFR